MNVEFCLCNRILTLSILYQSTPFRATDPFHFTSQSQTDCGSSIKGDPQGIEGRLRNSPLGASSQRRPGLGYRHSLWSYVLKVRPTIAATTERSSSLPLQFAHGPAPIGLPFSSPRVRKWFIIIIIIILDRVLSFSRDNDVAFFPSYNRKRKHTKIIKTKYCSIPHPLSPRGVKTVTHDQGRKMHLNSLFQGCRQWCGWSLEGTVIPRWAQQESVLLEADVSSGLLTQVLFHQQRLCPPEMPVVVRTGRAGVGDCVPLASSG